MFTLIAPHNLPTDITILPSPEWDDSQAQQLAVSLKRSMNNTIYTYVKRKNQVDVGFPPPDIEPQRFNFKYKFILTRLKSLELLAFIDTYYSVQIRWTDHKNNTWAGWIMTDLPTFQSIMINEITEINIELTGVPF